MATTKPTKPLSLAVIEGSLGKGKCKHSLFRFSDGVIAECCILGALAISYLGEKECARLTAPEHPDGASRDGEAYSALRENLPWLFKGDAGDEILRLMGLREKDVEYLHAEGYIHGDLASCLGYANDELSDGFDRAKNALIALSREKSEISVSYYMENNCLQVR